MLGTEREILMYLATYGNTRESDLVEYCVQDLGLSLPGSYEILGKMVGEGLIRRVEHCRLRQSKTYLSLNESLPLDAELDLLLGTPETWDKVEDEIPEILEEAAAAAERRIRRNRFEGSATG